MVNGKLSQSDIDALLKALENGELAADEYRDEKLKEKLVKPYNFKSPQKFSKDHLRTLERIHENFTRMISNYLSTELRINVRVNIKDVKQITYQEFIKDIPNSTVMSFFKMTPLQGNIMIGISYELAYQILELLLGGTGDRKIIQKEFTDIEKNIISKVTSGFKDSLGEAWKNIIEVTTDFAGIETNPTGNQVLGPNEPVALLTFAVLIGKHEEWINICIPYLSVEKFIDKLIIEYWYKSQDNEINEGVNYVEEALKPVPVEIKAELGTAQITIEEFLNLSPGDVLKLNKNIYSPAIVKIENLNTYLAQPGIYRKTSAVQIIDCVKGDERIYE